ncbi:hypothetical protein [Acinetobacter sp. YH01020]|uniref:hypothetical protein n=1 Tax=Acinetobacter sp. YH01020 TaxID=2601034 RepID=UPI0015D20038|nr:hypothetical protein [Acinetobacter sp. YH01020]
MAGRQTKTPGVETPKETTTAAQADAALEEILGTPDAKDAEPKTEEGAEVPEGAFIPVEQFDAVVADLEETKEQLAIVKKELAKLRGKSVGTSSAAQQPKRMKSVLGPKGWMMKEE